MNLKQKIEAAYAELRKACDEVVDMPQEPKYWQELCTARGRLCGLLNAAGRWA